MIPRRRWRIAWLLGIGVLVNYFDRVNVSIAHEALRSEFGLSNVGFGYVVGAFNWTYAALQLPMGVLLDRVGVRIIGRISALLWSLASFGAAVAPNIYSFFSMRLLLGIGEAPTFPANAKAIGHWFPRQERSFATSLFDGAAKFGPAVGAIGIGMLTIHFGWRWSFAATGALSFLYFLAFYFVYTDPKHDAKLSETEAQFLAQGGADEDHTAGRTAGAPLSYLLCQRKVWGLVIGFFGYNYCFYLLLYWLPSYFSQLRLDALHSALYTSIPWLFATACDLLIGGWLVDRLIRHGHEESMVRKAVLVGGTALGLAIAGAIFSRNAVVAAVWISIALGGLSAAAPVGWSIPALLAPPNSAGKVGSILNTGNQIAGIVAPVATGYLAGPANSFPRAFAAAAAVLILGILAYFALLGKIEPISEP